MLAIEALHPEVAIAAAKAVALHVRHHFDAVSTSRHGCPLTFGPSDPQEWHQLTAEEAMECFDSWHIEVCLMTRRTHPESIPDLLREIIKTHMGMVLFVRTEDAETANGVPMTLRAFRKGEHITFDPIRLGLIAEMYSSWQLKLMHLIDTKWHEVGS